MMFTQLLLRPNPVASAFTAKGGIRARHQPRTFSSTFSRVDAKFNTTSGGSPMVRARRKDEAHRGSCVTLAALAAGHDHHREMQHPPQPSGERDPPQFSDAAAAGFAAEQSGEIHPFANNVVRKHRGPAKKSTNKVRVQIVKTVTLDVDPEATIADVKAMIQANEDINAEDQLLYFAEKRLRDDFSVTQVPRKSTLVMRPRGEEFFVKTFVGDTVTLDFKCTDTVGDIMVGAAWVRA